MKIEIRDMLGLIISAVVFPASVDSKAVTNGFFFSRQSLFASTNTFTYTSLNNTVYIKHLLCILPLSLQGAMPLEHL